MLNGEMSSTFIMNSIKYQLMGKMMDKMMDKESELTKDVRDLVRFIGMKSIGTVMQVFALMVLSKSLWRNDGKTNCCKD